MCAVYVDERKCAWDAAHRWLGLPETRWAVDLSSDTEAVMSAKRTASGFWASISAYMLGVNLRLHAMESGIRVHMLFASDDEQTP